MKAAQSADPTESMQQLTSSQRQYHRKLPAGSREAPQPDAEAAAAAAAETEDGGSAGGNDSAEQDEIVTSLQMNSKKCPPKQQRAASRHSNPTKSLKSPSSKSSADAVIAIKEQTGEEGRPEERNLTGCATAIAVASNNKQRRAKRQARIFDPSGSLCYHWSMVVSFAFLYNFWSLSYRFAFREIDFDTVAFWFALDYCADLIYILDVVINFRTGYLEDGVLQRNIDKIGQHYRECTLFYLDCFCLLPLDILYLSIGFNSILRCTRLVKIYKFWSYADRTERHTNYPNVFRTFTLVHYILVIFHWNACLFHMISKNQILDIENLYKINDNRCEDILCQYLHAFYWSTLALTTIGDLPKPRTKGEYFYVTVELFFGLFLFASVLGHVANIVTNVSAARKEFQAKLDAVKTFMRMRRVSDELQNKVISWFDYLWVSQKSSDEERSVACLPDRLKAEIAIHVHLDTLKRVDIFQNTEAGFLCELVLRLKPVLFSPGDYVCRKNEVGHEMYIVSKGILEVVADGGKIVVATLKAGSYFGEISVLNVGLAGNKRTASVRSVGYSDLFCLNKQDLWDVLKNYPNAEARIRARAEERLSKLDINKQQQLPAPPSAGSCGALVCDSMRAKHPSASRWQKCYGGGECPWSAAQVAPCALRQHRRRLCSASGGSRYKSRRHQLNQVVPEVCQRSHHLPTPQVEPLRCARHRGAAAAMHSGEIHRHADLEAEAQEAEMDEEYLQVIAPAAGSSFKDGIDAAATDELRRAPREWRRTTSKTRGKFLVNSNNNNNMTSMRGADVQREDAATKGRDHIVTMPGGGVEDEPRAGELYTSPADNDNEREPLVAADSGRSQLTSGARSNSVECLRQATRAATCERRRPAGGAAQARLSSGSITGSCLSGGHNNYRVAGGGGGYLASAGASTRRSSNNIVMSDEDDYDIIGSDNDDDDYGARSWHQGCASCRGHSIEMGEPAAQHGGRLRRRGRRKQRQVGPAQRYQLPHDCRSCRGDHLQPDVAFDSAAATAASWRDRPPAIYQTGPTLWVQATHGGVGGQPPNAAQYIQVPLVATPSPFSASSDSRQNLCGSAAAAYQLLQPIQAGGFHSLSMSRLDGRVPPAHTHPDAAGGPVSSSPSNLVLAGDRAATATDADPPGKLAGEQQQPSGSSSNGPNGGGGGGDGQQRAGPR